MNANVKIRLTQIAGLLMLLAYWMTSAQPALASQLEPNGGGPAQAPGATPIAPTPIVVHDHTSAWTFVLVAALAAAVTLAAVYATRAARRGTTARPAKPLRPAAA